MVEKYEAYTDGSCNNLSPYGEGGSAYIILKDGEIVHQGAKGFLGTTNNRMELLAILSAICFVPEGSDLTIYTDSQYSISVLTSRFIKQIRPNSDIINKCIKSSVRLNSLEFIWVKGHNGNKYNEIADSLAEEQRETIRMSNNIPIYTYVNSPKVLEKSIRAKLQKEQRAERRRERKKSIRRLKNHQEESFLH